MPELVVAPDVRYGLYLPYGERALLHPRPYFVRHRLAEGVYL